MAEAFTGIEDLPDYNKEYALYKTAVREAGDEPTAKLEAENAWLKKERGFADQLHTHNESVRKFEVAKDRLAGEYANVPKEIYESLPTIEAMENAAKLFSEKLAEASPPPADPDPAPTGGGGQPPSGVGGDTRSATDWRAREAELEAKYQAGTLTKREAEEIFNVKANMRALPSLERARAEAKGNR